MWNQLPVGAAQNWAKCAQSSAKGRVQVANIVFELKKRVEAKGPIERFFRFLSTPFGSLNYRLRCDYGDSAFNYHFGLR